MKLAENEKLFLWNLKRQLDITVKATRSAQERLLAAVDKLSESQDLESVYEALSCIRIIKVSTQGTNNFNHQMACLAAKDFLEKQYPQNDWSTVDVLANDVNAGGIDIIAEFGTLKIAGEVKTMDPVKKNDFGGGQKVEIADDLRKLAAKAAENFECYFFVTEPRAFEVITRKYNAKNPFVNFVILRNPSVQDLVRAATASGG